MTKNIPTKECLHCGILFHKGNTKSMRDWKERVRFCSRACIRRFYGSNFKGKKHTDESRQKNRVAHLGDKSSLWKGGISATNHRERGWYRAGVRRAVFERDGNMCVECSLKNFLQVAHIKPFADFPELRYDINNCRTLCMSCHFFETFKRELPSGMTWGFTKLTVTG